MDDIRALNDAVGQSIMATLMPTFNIFAPHLLANKSKIQAFKPTTETYGSHPRQLLDVYRPVSPAEGAPILVFLYGGGLTMGDRILTRVPEGLVYGNVGAFFASRGFTTIIPDYRRVNSSLGGEDAVFPSGGEDVSLVLKWLESFEGSGTKDVFIMGNSAGGVHILTFLFGEMFLEQRRRYVDGENGVKLKGAVEVAVPCHFDTSDPGREDALKAYYGSKQDVGERSPHGLLEALAKAGVSRREAAVPKVLALVGEFDPRDEIAGPMEVFVELWKKTWGEGIDFEVMEGHNHLSPVAGLMAGDMEEKWCEDVVKWIKELK